MNRWLFRLAVTTLAALCLVGAVRTMPTSGASTSDLPSMRDVKPLATSSAAPTTGGAAPLVRPDGDSTAAPTRIRVPRLGVDSSLESLRTGGDGELLAPRRWQRAGWFSEGTRPGDVGPAVIAGHVDSPTGPAVFARLAEIRSGDEIVVQQTDGGSVTFRVDRTEMAPKRAFPTRAVYGPTPNAQLRLITCDGPYVESSGGYQDNLIVFASEVTA